MRVTIFTPTYNRKHTLERTFRSLCAQSSKDFEWLVVDDGSTDDTESFIARCGKEAEFPVRYFKKANGGKHTAYNIGLKEAKGELFFDVDSDDWLPDDFMDSVKRCLPVIRNNPEIAGIISLKSDKNGNLLGKVVSEVCRPVPYRELMKCIEGEYSLVFKTDIARRFRFPIVEGETFMPETVVYDRFVNFSFLTDNHIYTYCEYLPDGLSMSYNRCLVDNPVGFMMYHQGRLKICDSLLDRVINMIQIIAFAKLAYRRNGCKPDSGLSWGWRIGLCLPAWKMVRNYLMRADR